MEACLLTLALLTFNFSLFVDGHPVEKRNISLSSPPANWREMIDDAAYDYSIKKSKKLVNVKKFGGMFEGDIAGIDLDALDKKNISIYLGENFSREKQDPWPNSIVPYNIGDGQFTREEEEVIDKALQDMMAKTCIQFIPRTNEKSYITFVSQHDGGVIGQQFIQILEDGCVTKLGEVQHEVMHALGFYHEQTRTDRDNYVEIYLKNVVETERHNFEKYSGNTFNLPYDYNSIMHYGYTDFSHDGVSLTMLPKKKGAIVGHREVMSPLDVQRINLAYRCNSHLRDTQQKPVPERHRSTSVDFQSLFDRLFNNGDTIFVFGSEGASEYNRTAPVGSANSTNHNCPADSPHKLRNDFCQNDQDCKNSGLGRFCCRVVDKNCTSFCV